MDYTLIDEIGITYIETKGGKNKLLLLHGLSGALSNFNCILNHFGKKYNVIVPLLPIYDIPMS